MAAADWQRIDDALPKLLDRLLQSPVYGQAVDRDRPPAEGRAWRRAHRPDDASHDQPASSAAPVPTSRRSAGKRHRVDLDEFALHCPRCAEREFGDDS